VVRRAVVACWLAEPSSLVQPCRAPRRAWAGSALLYAAVAAGLVLLALRGRRAVSAPNQHGVGLGFSFRGVGGDKAAERTRLGIGPTLGVVLNLEHSASRSPCSLGVASHNPGASKRRSFDLIRALERAVRVPGGLTRRRYAWRCTGAAERRQRRSGLCEDAELAAADPSDLSETRGSRRK
jgi:hypothetical protein